MENTAANATLLDSLARHADQTPDKAAFVFETDALSFGAFARDTDQIAAALRASGIAAGERIAYVGKNTTAFFALLFGAMKAGAVVAPINWRLAPPEVAAIIADARARLVVLGREFTDEPRYGSLAGVEIVLASEGGHTSLPSLTEWSQSSGDHTIAHSAAPSDVAVQLYTSGTTGLPKGVMLTHANIMGALEASETHNLGWNQWTSDDVALLAMPVSHISGTGWGAVAMHHGATCHIQRQFDLEQTLDALAQHRITRMFLVPAALQMLVRHPRAASTDFSCLHEASYGASPMPLPLLRECMNVMRVPFVQFYGMTETAGTIVALPAADHDSALSTPALEHRLRAAGRALPWVELRIVDAAGAEVPRGVVGELVTRSGATMAGYWEKPADTARTIDAEGWLHTGDAGTMDADGYIFIHDRVKDMIITGGENVYPAEVESALAEHPAIAEVAVIGVPDERWGEAVKAIVVLRPDARLDAADLIAWSRTQIAAFKAPSSVDFAETLPRNASGKLLKRALRAPYWTQQTRQVN